jgi:hypothetical protein
MAELQTVKGATDKIVCTVYSVWTGSPSTSTVQDITGATIKGYFKNSEFDSDASAVFTKTGSITNATGGICEVPIAASDTNTLAQSVLYFEAVAKLSDGVTYIRSGSQPIALLSNVGKTLF